MLPRLANRLQNLTSRSTAPLIRKMTTQNSKETFQGLPVIPDQPYTVNSPRRVAQAHIAIEVEEGVGMRVRRSIGTSRLRNLTPFLMLDHFDSSFGSTSDAGAPDHPHRVCKCTTNGAEVSYGGSC